MEPITSGTTTERVIRTAILTLLFVGYSVWSFVDGYITYPKKNVTQLMQNLSPVPETPPPFNRKVTQAIVESLPGKSVAELQALLGDPAGVSPLKDEVGRSLGQLNHYFGPGGMAQVRIKDGSVIKNGVRWRPGSHDESALFLQLAIGGVTGVLGLLMIVQLLRAFTTRIELTEQGLEMNSQGGWRFGSPPFIPFEAMTALVDPGNRFADRRSDYVELEYTLADGTTGQVRLNNYVHAAFGEILTEICNRKGFDNPQTQHQSDEHDDHDDHDEPTDQAPEYPAADSESQSQL